MNYHPGIVYKIGDATRPTEAGPKVIAHICNDIGAWGRGFVLALSQTHPLAEQEYRSWYQQNGLYENFPCKLGNTLYVNVGNNTWVANMVAQTGIFPKNGVPPIRYDALEKCLTELAEFALSNGASVHLPRIGCGLAGGRWKDVEAIIERTLVNAGVATHVYDLQADDARIIPWQK